MGGIETLVVAASKFGRLRRLWPSAEFLERPLAGRLDLTIVREPGKEDYLEKLADQAELEGAPFQLGFGQSMSDLPNLFRAPTTAVRPRRVMNVASLERRRLSAPSWGCSLPRARAYFDLKRWLPSRPSWWAEYDPSVETPAGVSYVASRLTDPDNMASIIVFDEFSCFLTAAWVEWLTVNGLFCWLP